MKLKEKIYEKLNSMTKIEIKDSSIVLELGIDSLDLMELITEAEDELKVMIDDADLENIKTVKDVIDAFKKASKK